MAAGLAGCSVTTGTVVVRTWTALIRAPAAVTATKAGHPDNFGNSLGTTVTIPSNEGTLAGSYTFSHQYTPTLGLLALDIDPATDRRRKVVGCPDQSSIRAAYVHHR